MSRAPEILTFGCRLNAFESEVIRNRAEAAGLSDAVIVNTCAVTAEAERQARQAIRKARRARPDAQIIVTGCAAQVNPQVYAAMPEVDRVLGNREKLDAASFAPDSGARISVDDIMSAQNAAAQLAGGFEGRSRAFVQMQNGCDHRCTFCIIPYGRGNSRSAPLGDIVAQARSLVEQGFREIVLTGVDITAYGTDLPGRPTLGGTVRRLLRQVPDLPRLRLSSIDVAEADDDLLRLLADEPRLMPHLHLSLQAGDDLVLKRMKRRHSFEQAVAFCARARAVRPDVTFGADLIAGFPTETEAQFRRSLELVDACDLTWLHVFPYSARAGTPAARMPQLAKAVRRERAARLREAGATAVRRYLASRVGTEAEVLVESATRGRTQHYAPVNLDAAATEGALLRVTVTGHDGEALVGAAIERVAA